MLNNFFIIFLILIFFTKFTFGNEPTDIWSLEKKEKGSGKKAMIGLINKHMRKVEDHTMGTVYECKI